MCVCVCVYNDNNDNDIIIIIIIIIGSSSNKLYAPQILRVVWSTRMHLRRLRLLPGCMHTNRSTAVGVW